VLEIYCGSYEVKYLGGKTTITNVFESKLRNKLICFGFVKNETAFKLLTDSIHFLFQLFKNVAERGRWAEMLPEAYSMYKEGHISQALMKYVFLAELGYEVAQSNVAYMLDQGKMVTLEV
jgi:hypothetical protein